MFVDYKNVRTKSTYMPMRSKGERKICGGGQDKMAGPMTKIKIKNKR